MLILKADQLCNISSIISITMRSAESPRCTHNICDMFYCTVF